MDKVLDNKLPSLSVIQKQEGAKVFAFIKLYIADFTRFVNVKNNMNEPQVDMTAQLIFEEFYFLNLADLRLFFHNAKKGKYGKLYDRLDGTMLMSWLNRYVDERIGTAETRQLNKHRQIVKPDFSERSGDSYEQKEQFKAVLQDYHNKVAKERFNNSQSEKP